MQLFENHLLHKYFWRSQATISSGYCYEHLFRKACSSQLWWLVIVFSKDEQEFVALQLIRGGYGRNRGGSLKDSGNKQPLHNMNLKILNLK